MKPKPKPKPKTSKAARAVELLRSPLRKREHFSLDSQKNGKFRIVAFGSRVYIGPMSLKAIKASPDLKTYDLSLEDAIVAKEELEVLMEEKLKAEK